MLTAKPAPHQAASRRACGASRRPSSEVTTPEMPKPMSAMVTVT